ncbi:hypothetical protein ILUMI_14555 [Ignelater luminosus]|uniref:Uncharacterized protein n=1 Tax=Ignelater luminosus TaxID=2038154 RepID=A0A8K0CVR6_IGNLU|nr:hypothetical protein ILUMI_14555 [Ignelater luminosus]
MKENNLTEEKQIQQTAYKNNEELLELESTGTSKNNVDVDGHSVLDKNIQALDAADQLSGVSVAILQEDSDKKAEEALENAELYTKYVYVGPCLESHENSSEHKKSLLVWLTRKENKSVIDKELQEQLKYDTEYYHNVLKRVVAIVKYL